MAISKKTSRALKVTDFERDRLTSKFNVEVQDFDVEGVKNC
jgi:hypothetical protein